VFTIIIIIIIINNNNIQLRFEELLLRNTADNYIILNHHIPQDSIGNITDKVTTALYYYSLLLCST
jgi:hypothetical protein